MALRTRLTLKFDANQDFQLQAVEAVAALFDGYRGKTVGFQMGDEIVPNVPPHEAFDATWLGDNLRAVQEANRLPTQGLKLESELEVQGVSDGSWDYPSFTVEMETGTGKTYVYLRTIHELRRRYGWGKYVVVVPSIAIYEGVIKTFEITRAHFAALYGNERVSPLRYDGSQLSQLRSYATSPFCEVLVMTLDSFNKVSNLFYRPSEKLPGERRPYQFVQDTRPIVILDEPQNMESEIARSAIATLHPLFTLRYSATHRTSPNLVYRLTPFEAFQRSLVKRIQVWGVTDSEDYNRPFLSLKSVTREGGIRARVVAYVLDGGQTREKEIALRQGEDLHVRTHRDEHRGGYVVAEIDAARQCVTFENGLTIEKGVALAPSRPELFKVQIEETIRRHFETQERLRPLGIKVLSLFFIDRVAHYAAKDGLIRSTFDEAFRKVRKHYPNWGDLEPDQVQSAYFAKKQTKDGEQAIEIDPEKGPSNDEQRQAAKLAFELIMQDKERLLSFDEKVGFIFAHSALKEGWDNPNVFQICTLNQTRSEIRKRQEIGRGLRLCVNQAGERIRDDEVNVLTVVANQSYESYAVQLQQEYIEEGEGDKPPPKPGNARQAPARRNEAVVATPEFKEFWRRLSQRIAYHIHIDTPELIKACVGRLSSSVEWPAPRIVVQEGEYVVHRLTLTLEEVSADRARIRVDTLDSRDNKSTIAITYAEGADLAVHANNPRLRGYKLAEIIGGAEPRAVFENKVVLYRGQPQRWESVEGQQVRRRIREANPVSPPIPNLLTRTASETGLTRATVNEVFRRLPARVKQALFRDPEGFTGLFTATVRSILADHIADRLECVVAGPDGLLADEFFPREVRFAQRELVDAGKRGLYDKVQRDSGVEDTFIARLRDDERIVLFFKFPPKFVVLLPRLIGNYNPDWGIVRRDDSGVLTLHLVRETKGTIDLNRLQFPHEKRKIVCATRYFGAAAVDYRVVTDQTVRWWDSKAIEAVQEELRVD
jgi:type III restriction enzyme